MRRVPFSIFKRLNTFWRKKYSVVKRKGVSFLLDKDNWIDKRILSFKFYEQKNLYAMVELSKQLSFDYFFDIGANIGYFSVHVGTKTAIPKCIAFEPLRKNYYQLCANVFLNHLENKVILHNCALGESKYETSIKFNDSSTGISTIVPENTARSASDYQKSEMILVESLDDIYQERGKKILMKMDVEGFEHSALKGMIKFLSSNAVVLFIEINDQTSPVFQFLADLGYKRVSLNTEDYVYSNMAAVTQSS
jgi:FkbM family methyltransferase